MPTPILAMIPSGFKTSKFASVLPSDGTGDFTVVRNSSKTRVNSSGLIETLGVNVIAPDYKDGGCPVLLTEPQSTNNLIFSKTFSNWTENGTTTTTNTTNLSPANEPLTVLLSGATDIAWGSNSNAFTKGLDVNSNSSYTFTVFVKSLGSSSVNLRIRNNNSGSNSDSTTSLNLNEWKRVSISINTTATQSLAGLVIGGIDGDILIWGTQFEPQPNATSYIPTNGSTVTRFADVVTIDTTSITGTISSITETIDGVDQTPITTIPSTYTMPVGNINKIIME